LGLNPVAVVSTHLHTKQNNETEYNTYITIKIHKQTKEYTNITIKIHKLEN